MKKTALVYSSKYLDHKTGYLHPESPSRLRVIIRELNKSGILQNDQIFMYKPQNVYMKDLKKVHDQSYIQKIRRFCQCGGGFLDKEDTFVSLKSFDENDSSDSKSLPSISFPHFIVNGL